MNNPTVLVIEDDWRVRQAVVASLEREGHRLIFASSGQEGLDLIRQESPTVIILDLDMPTIDCCGFRRQFARKPSDAYGVIVLTSQGNEDAIKELYDAGVCFFLDKPFNSYQLRGLVSSAMTVRGLNNRLHDLVLQRTAELEQRITEITAVNRFYQEQSDELLSLVDQCHRALEDRRRILRVSDILTQRAEPFPLPDDPGFPKPDPGDLSAGESG